MNYVTLDYPNIRALAKSDPELFLQQYESPLIIDEIQYAPKLLSYIKIRVDNINEPGQYFLTGSQMFYMMKNVSETLAGRVGILSMYSIDNVGQVHVTSGYGKESIDIGAPGESVKVFLPENEELYVDGTSVAAAFVSGIAALMLSENLELTPNEVKNIMISTARPIEVLSMKCVSGGIIDACAAINYLRKE